METKTMKFEIGDNLIYGLLFRFVAIIVAIDNSTPNEICYKVVMKHLDHCLKLYFLKHFIDEDRWSLYHYTGEFIADYLNIELLDGDDLYEQQQ